MARLENDFNEVHRLAQSQPSLGRQPGRRLDPAKDLDQNPLIGFPSDRLPAGDRVARAKECVRLGEICCAFFLMAPTLGQRHACHLPGPSEYGRTPELEDADGSAAM